MTKPTRMVWTKVTRRDLNKRWADKPWGKNIYVLAVEDPKCEPTTIKTVEGILCRPQTTSFDFALRNVHIYIVDFSKRTVENEWHREYKTFRSYGQWTFYVKEERLMF